MKEEVKFNPPTEQTGNERTDGGSESSSAPTAIERPSGGNDKTSSEESSSE